MTPVFILLGGGPISSSSESCVKSTRSLRLRFRAASSLLAGFLNSGLMGIISATGADAGAGVCAGGPAGESSFGNGVYCSALAGGPEAGASCGLGTTEAEMTFFITAGGTGGVCTGAGG